MTLEEMKAEAQKVVEALRTAGFDEVGIIEEDIVNGEPIPISYFNADGDAFVVTVMVA